MSASLPAWNDLEIFLAAARKGTLAAAGAALNVNASTVQRRIGKLEAKLSTRLFERSKRGYALTSAGEELFGHALAIEQEVLAIGRRMGGRDQMLEGRVRVATVDDLAISILLPIFHDFRKHHPKVTLDLDISSSFADLARQHADVAIRFGAKPTHGDLVVKHVSRIDVGLYASRKYLRANGRPRSLEDLREHPIVRGDARMEAIASERLIERYSDPSRIALRSNSMLARLTAIRQGLGIGLVGCFMGERERTLECVDLELPDLASDLWMVVHVDLRQNARVRAFVDFVYAALIDLRSCFEAPR